MEQTTACLMFNRASERGRKGERERTSLVMEMGNSCFICNMNP